MPTWGEIGREIAETPAQPPTSPFDIVRRKYLKELADYSGRSTIAYMTAGFAPPQGAVPPDIQISIDPDQQAFMEVVHGLPRDIPIDLLLHSPGGTSEAAETLIEYLRGRFPGLRVIVPLAAMSAATMMAMGADSIVMGSHSQLGPIDPQLTIVTPQGPRTAPAAAIRAQFEAAKLDLAQHPENLSAWLPILSALAPALLQVCDDSEALAKTMVASWLERYMFAGRDDAAAEAAVVAAKLSDYPTNMSHARRIGRDELRTMGLEIVDLEDDQVLQDLVLSVFHSVSHTFDQTGTVKLVENHLGRAYIRRVQQIAVPIPDGLAIPGVTPTNPQLSRQQRRANDRRRN